MPMNLINIKNLILLFALMCSSIATAVMPYNSSNKLPIFRSELKVLSDKAIVLAQNRLATNSKDNIGLMLLKFAEHFAPEKREVLLLRGKLHYNVKIIKSKTKVSETEFLGLLQHALDRVDDKHSVVARHLTAVFCSMIRLFAPADEKSIIILTQFRDKGFATELKPLFERDLQATSNIRYDERDSRYVISNIKKSIMVPANQPWTDSFVKVEAGKFVRVKAFRTWEMGDVGKNIPACDADGYADFNPLDPNSKKVTKKKKGKKVAVKKYYKSSLQAFPGSLLAKIGKKSYPVGREAVFRAETSGILYFGPYEWADYSDNAGALQVSFEISDK
jgi:hypothetical protein